MVLHCDRFSNLRTFATRLTQFPKALYPFCRPLWFVCSFNTCGNVLALELNCEEAANVSSSFLLRDRKISTSFLLSEEVKAHPGL